MPSASSEIGILLLNKENEDCCPRICEGGLVLEKVEVIHHEKDEYLDPLGYWITPEREIKRMGSRGGEQTTIIKAVAGCSDAEWERFYAAIVACLDTMK
jgi:hypothetical protein